MKSRLLIVIATGLLFMVSASHAFAALPTVNTFTVSATAVSPVPVTAFTASDSDGTVVGYMITETSSKPAATNSGWTSAPWTTYTTTSIGSRTLYAWAKDNANGVSNSRTASTNVVGGHNHTMSQVTGLTAALAGKANKPARVVTVAKSGGDFDDPGIALDSITDASSENRYLVKILPGVYQITRSLVVRDYVDVEGSGPENTELYSSWSGFYAVYAVMFQNTTHKSEVRQLSIVFEDSACGLDGLVFRAIAFQGAGPGVIRNVKVRSKGAVTQFVVGGIDATVIDSEFTVDPACSVMAWGIYYPLQMTVIGSTFNLPWPNSSGVELSGEAFFVARDTVIDVAGNGVVVSGSGTGAAEFHQGGIKGGQNSLSIGSGASFKAAGTQISGPITSGGNTKLFNCYDLNFDPIAFP